MSSFANNAGQEIVGCPDCGAIQAISTGAARGARRCGRCGRTLERMNGRSLLGGLGCALATLLLLFPANLLPILQVNILAATNISFIGSGVFGIWTQGWPVAAIVVGLEIVVLPFLRFGLLSAVLGMLWAGQRARWLGPAFRWAEYLDQWAMIDVFLFGGLIGYARVVHAMPVQILAGGYCAICAAFFSLVTRAALERREIWRLIGPAATQREEKMICCTSCDYPLPATQEGKRCPRCHARVWHCRPYAAMRALALTLAAFAFYPIAYIYPMESSDVLDDLHGYSIMTGVLKLVQADLWFFAAVVFIASVAIPLLKLFAFAWFGMSIHRRSAARLRLKTKLYRLIDTIGRWSHIDVFTVSVFLPLMQLNGLLSIVVGKALPAFLAVVVITMAATSFFDPRALWLAAERRA
ncbi:MULTISPECIES: paraquat-inducible protein A [unclassified Acidocella]|uniref:paraquat-inducible protein A n=1 Tax=unclassified Acidocella TaxID=2648610 RepID=UPI00028C59A3|nr:MULTISPECIES: paraquat-inducible protein A [unclassified Acidocella]EKM98214.1 paraquat-inducible protein A [Acidocella sp. MX-AZ02]WBO61040.1 paraquat-inducible protein A [Acidocella sp. MX-AZ03]